VTDFVPISPKIGYLVVSLCYDFALTNPLLEQLQLGSFNDILPNKKIHCVSKRKLPDFFPQKITANYVSVTENMKSFEALKSY